MNSLRKSHFFFLLMWWPAAAGIGIIQQLVLLQLTPALTPVGAKHDNIELADEAPTSANNLSLNRYGGMC